MQLYNSLLYVILQDYTTDSRPLLDVLKHDVLVCSTSNADSDVHGSVHRKYIPIYKYIQQDATLQQFIIS